MKSHPTTRVTDGMLDPAELTADPGVELGTGVRLAPGWRAPFGAARLLLDPATGHDVDPATALPDRLGPRRRARHPNRNREPARETAPDVSEPDPGKGPFVAVASLS